MSEVLLTDFRMAAFLVARGNAILGTRVNDRGEVVFRFDSSVQKTLNMYPGSPEAAYDVACKSMQSLIRATIGIKRLPVHR